MLAVVEPESVWSSRKCVIMAAFVAATSVTGLSVVDQVNEGMDYEMPDLWFFPLFLGAGLVYPAVMMVVWYKRMPRARLALWHWLSYGLVWYLTFSAYVILDRGLSGQLPGDGEGLLNWLIGEAISAATVLLIVLALGMALWGVCRLVRKRVVINDGAMCRSCAYDLTGNVSGVCPECGAPQPASEEPPSVPPR
jgi:hypothetical protein